MLQIYLFNQLRVLSDNNLVKFVALPRTLPLLAYLLLHRALPTSRETAAFTLWADHAEADARTNLRRHLHDLKRALPPPSSKGPWLLADNETLQWNPAADYWLDVAEFERCSNVPDRLADAISLYTGDLLDNVYDDWLFYERERLRTLYLDDLKKLIEQHETLQDYRRAIQFAQHLLRSSPLSEEPYQYLMRLHALSGDRAGMVRYYNTCVATLQRELKIEPSPETREVYEHFLRLELHRALTSDPPHPQSRPDAFPNNLPIQLTAFIGRERERVEINHLLSRPTRSTWQVSLRLASRKSLAQGEQQDMNLPGENRLVTLTGCAGVGKTRLALEVAADLLPIYSDGVWLVNLAPIADATLIPQAIASVLGVRAKSSRSILDTVMDGLRDKQLLLILDNCEHLVMACATVAETLLRAVHSLRILATSREPLGITGETVWRVQPLAVPMIREISSNIQDPYSALQPFEGARLFVDRATAALPTFALTNENAAIVAQVCRALDGLPLAIELAAARLKVLTVEQIGSHLDQVFHLLTRGTSTALPRHQTLRAAMDWTYNLLSEQERSLFRRLSIFVGGFTLEDVQVMCADVPSQGQASATNPIVPDDILDLMSNLIDKSLVVMTERKDNASGDARYSMLNTIGQYARERLAGSGEIEETRKRHAQYFLSLAERASSGLPSTRQTLWLARLGDEHDNLRAALQWSVDAATRDGDTSASSQEALLRLGGALWRFWEIHGDLSEGRAWLEKALKTGDAASVQVRAEALYGAGNLARQQGDFRQASTLIKESITLWRQSEHKLGTARSLDILGEIERVQGNYMRAITLHDEALSLRRKIGDQLGTADTLSRLGRIAIDQGDYRRAIERYQQSLSIWRPAGDKLSIALSLNNLGVVAFAQGDYARASVLHEESLGLYRELGDKRGLAYALHYLGNVKREQGEYSGASRYYTESLALKQELGDKRGIASSWISKGELARIEGDFLHAHSFQREALALAREVGDRRGFTQASALGGRLAIDQHDNALAASLFGESLAMSKCLGDKAELAWTLESIGEVERSQKHYKRAVARLKESLTLFHRLNAKKGIAECLAHLAAVAGDERYWKRAARLAGAAESLFETIGAVLPPADRAEFDRNLAAIRAQLDEATFDGLWNFGRALTVEQAVKYALTSHCPQFIPRFGSTTSLFDPKPVH